MVVQGKKVQILGFGDQKWLALHKFGNKVIL